MSFFSLLGAVEIGLIFSLVALGVFISFRLLRFPDLTVDGSFPLGGAVCAILISTGTNPFVATIAAFGINYRDLGEQTGRMVVRILKGEKPGDIKPEISTKMELFVNPGAAEKQGVKLSDALVKSAAQVVQ